MPNVALTGALDIDLPVVAQLGDFDFSDGVQPKIHIVDDNIFDNTSKTTRMATVTGMFKMLLCGQIKPLWNVSWTIIPNALIQRENGWRHKL